MLKLGWGFVLSSHSCSGHSCLETQETSTWFSVILASIGVL